MAEFSRRTFLKLSGGLAGILASHQAPVFAQQSTVHWIRWNDFVPASDELLRKSILPEASKALGLKINFETVNANDLFYWPPGHNVKVDADADIVMFSPQREHTLVIDHMIRKVSP